MRKEKLAPGIVMIHGDCLSILPRISSVDHVITDPPYSADMQGLHTEKKLRRRDGGPERRLLDFQSIDHIRDPFLKHVKRINHGWLLAFSDVESVGAWKQACIDHHLKFKTTCLWVKPDATPQINGQGPALAHECIITTWCGRGHARWNGGGKRGILTHNTNSPEKSNLIHPAVKPLPLMKELISLFTDQDDLVLDPFAGSGTTGVAAAKLRRRFLGMESDTKYFDLACQRIQKALDEPDFFTEKPKRLRDSFWRAAPLPIPTAPPGIP